MTLEELDPELFSLELYTPYGMYELSDALYVASSIGWCDASRLLVRPKEGEVAIMIEWDNGKKGWCHATWETLDSIRERMRILRRLAADRRPRNEQRKDFEN